MSGGQNFQAIEFAIKKSADLAVSNVDRYGFRNNLNGKTPFVQPLTPS